MLSRLRRCLIHVGKEKAYANSEENSMHESARSHCLVGCSSPAELLLRAQARGDSMSVQDAVFGYRSIARISKGADRSPRQPFGRSTWNSGVPSISELNSWRSLAM